MKTLLIFGLLLMSLSSYSTEKTYYVRNTNEMETEKSIIVIKEIGAYRIFKICSLVAYLYKGKVNINNPKDCQNIGNGMYKYNNADLMSYQKKLSEKAQRYSNIDNALTTSSILAGTYTFLLYSFEFSQILEFGSTSGVLNKYKKSAILAPLFTVVTGYLSSIADDIQDENDLMVSVLKSATEPVAQGAELKIDITISEFINHLNKLLILGQKEGTITAVTL